jgi:hypothetical protein
VVLLSSDWSHGAEAIAKECLCQLFSQLDLPGDRLAVIYYHSNPTLDDHMSLDCIVAHPLEHPDLAYCCEQLAPHLRDVPTGSPQADWRSLHEALDDVASLLYQPNLAPVFIVSRDPRPLAHALLEVRGWSVNQIKVGLHNSESAPARTDRTSRAWKMHLRSLQDIRPYTFEELFGGLRRGDIWESISSLHLSCKPTSDCVITETIGQKLVKNLRPGESCQLFVNLYIPELKIKLSDPLGDSSLEAMYTEVESMLGILKTDVLQVEAEYRHPMLPSENIIRLQHTFSVNRPQSDSLWSSRDIGSTENMRVMGALAHFIATRYNPCHGLKMINRWITHSASTIVEVQQARDYLETLIAKQRHTAESRLPHIIVGDSGNTSAGWHGMYGADMMPDLMSRSPPETTLRPTTASSERSPTSPTFSHPLPPLPADAQPELVKGPSREARDSAREVWDQRVRRKSLTSQQLLHLTSEVQRFEASDDHLRVLHNKALANKRSVGVETLRAWQIERVTDETTAADEQRSPPWL